MNKTRNTNTIQIEKYVSNTLKQQDALFYLKPSVRLLILYLLLDILLISLFVTFQKKITDAPIPVDTTGWLVIIGILLFICVLLTMGYALYMILSYIVIKKDKIKIKQGVLSLNETTIYNDAIIGVNYHQNIIDILFGIGDIYIITAGNPSEKFTIRHIDNPKQIAKVITHIIEE